MWNVKCMPVFKRIFLFYRNALNPQTISTIDRYYYICNQVMESHAFIILSKSIMIIDFVASQRDSFSLNSRNSIIMNNNINNISVTEEQLLYDEGNCTTTLYCGYRNTIKWQNIIIPRIIIIVIIITFTKPFSQWSIMLKDDGGVLFFRLQHHFMFK